METVPRIMRAIRAEMRRQGAPLLSVPQVRSLAFLHRSPGACLSHLAGFLGVSRPHGLRSRGTVWSSGAW